MPANGDTANKIGTYMVAVLARTHEIPFYIAAPRSTIDRACQDGTGIPIEQRDPSEVTHLNGKTSGPGRRKGPQSRLRRHAQQVYFRE